MEPEVPVRAKVFLCASYALAAWAWRSWEFIVALVLIELYPDSLLMVSAYGLLDNMARVLLSPAVGGYVDRHERLPGAQAMLRLQNLCIGGSASAALVLLWPRSAAIKQEAVYWPLMWLLTVLGATSSAGSTGVSISVEREAVKTLCGADGRALAALNSVMRAIDLTALLCAPLAAGLLMTAAGPFTAVAAMAAYCGVAYMPEVLLLGAAFRVAPVLGRSKIRAAVGSAAAGSQDGALGAADADTEERTGLLAACANYAGESAAGKQDADSGGGDSGKAGHTATIAIRATDAGPLRSCFEDPTGGCTSSGGAEGKPPSGVQASGRADGSDGDGDSDLGILGTDSALLNQPLLLGAAESLPTSMSATWGGADEGPVTGNQRGSSMQPCGVVVPAGGVGELSTTSSVTALAVMAPIATTSGGGGAAAARLRALLLALGNQLRSYGDSWRVYLQQPVLLLCLALALLYMTVLSLGFLMTSFLKWSGLSEAEVSGYRGIGALTGLAATAIFPPLSARAGLLFCALAGVTYQLACLAAGVLPVVMGTVAGGDSLRPSVTQVHILVAGLVSSRTGLWLYDLAVTQLIQEEVRQDQLGAVYGVQSSLQASFEMMSFVAGLVSPYPVHFHWLMLGSLGSVMAAGTLAWCHACLKRGRAPRSMCGSGAA